MMTFAIVGGNYLSWKLHHGMKRAVPPTVIILWRLSFRWRISRKYDFLRPNDVVREGLCQLLLPCLCLKAQMFERSDDAPCLLSPLMYYSFPPPPYNQTLPSLVLPVSIISTLHPAGLIKPIQIWTWVVHTARSWSKLMYRETARFDFIVTRVFPLTLWSLMTLIGVLPHR